MNAKNSDGDEKNNANPLPLLYVYATAVDCVWESRRLQHGIEFTAAKCGWYQHREIRRINRQFDGAKGMPSAAFQLMDNTFPHWSVIRPVDAGRTMA
jgi:hypothetical protein